MATDIYFAGGSVRLTVDGDPGEVAEAFNAAQGLPFRLTAQGDRGEVYVNPAMVAFWSATDAEPQTEVGPDSEQASNRRQAVTDLWGNPIRSRPRG